MAEPNVAWLNKKPSSPWELVQSPARQPRQKDALHHGSGRGRDPASMAARIMLVSKSLADTTPRRARADVKEANTRNSPYALRSRGSGPADGVPATGANGSPDSSQTPETGGKANREKPSKAQGHGLPKPCNVARAEPSPTRFEVHALYTGVLSSSLRLRDILDKNHRSSPLQHKYQPPEGAAANVAPSGARPEGEPFNGEVSHSHSQRTSLPQAHGSNGPARSQLALLARALVDPGEAGSCDLGSVVPPGPCIRPNPGPGGGCGSAGPVPATARCGKQLVGQQVGRPLDAVNAVDADVSMAELDACLAAGSATIQVLAAPQLDPDEASANLPSATARLGTATRAAHNAAAAAATASGVATCASQWPLRCIAPNDLRHAVQSVQGAVRTASPVARSPAGLAAASVAAAGTTPTHGSVRANSCGAGIPESANIRLQLPEPCPVKALQAVPDAALSDSSHGRAGAGASDSGTPAVGNAARQGEAVGAAVTRGAAAASTVPAAVPTGSRVRRERSASRLNPEHPGNAQQKARVGALEKPGNTSQALARANAAAPAPASGAGAEQRDARRRPAEGATAAIRPVAPCVALGSENSPNLVAAGASGVIRQFAAGADLDMPRRRIHLDTDGSPEGKAGPQAGAPGPGDSSTPAPAHAVAAGRVVAATGAAKGNGLAGTASRGPASTCPSSDQSLTIAQLVGCVTTSTKAPSPSAVAVAAGVTLPAPGDAELPAPEEGAAAVVAVQLSAGEEDSVAASPLGEEQQQQQSVLMDHPAAVKGQPQLVQSALAEASHWRAGKADRRGRRLKGRRSAADTRAASEEAGAHEVPPGGKDREADGAVGGMLADGGPAVTPAAGLRPVSAQLKEADGGDESSPDLPIGKLAEVEAAVAARRSHSAVGDANMPPPPLPFNACATAAATTPAAPKQAAADPPPQPSNSLVPPDSDVPIGMLAAAAVAVAATRSPESSPHGVGEPDNAEAAEGRRADPVGALWRGVHGRQGGATVPLSAPQATGAKPAGAQAPPPSEVEAAGDGNGAAPSRKKRKWRSPSPSSAPPSGPEKDNDDAGRVLSGDGAATVPLDVRRDGRVAQDATLIAAAPERAGVTGSAEGTDGRAAAQEQPRATAATAVNPDPPLNGDAPPPSLASVTAPAAATEARSSAAGVSSATCAADAEGPPVGTQAAAFAASAADACTTAAPAAAAGAGTTGAAPSAGRLQLGALWKRQRVAAPQLVAQSGPRSVAGRLRAHVGAAGPSGSQEEQHQQLSRQQDQGRQQEQQETGARQRDGQPIQQEQDQQRGQQEQEKQEQELLVQAALPDSTINGATSAVVESIVVEDLQAPYGVQEQDLVITIEHREQQQQEAQVLEPQQQGQAEQVMQVEAPIVEQGYEVPSDAVAQDQQTAVRGGDSATAAEEEVAMEVDKVPQDDQRQGHMEQGQESDGVPNSLNAPSKQGQPAALAASDPAPPQQPARVHIRNVWKRQRALEPPSATGRQARGRGAAALPRSAANQAVATAAAAPPVADGQPQPQLQARMEERGAERKAGAGPGVAAAVDGMDCGGGAAAAAGGVDGEVEVRLQQRLGPAGDAGGGVKGGMSATKTAGPVGSGAGGSSVFCTSRDQGPEPKEGDTRAAAASAPLHNDAGGLTAPQAYCGALLPPSPVPAWRSSPATLASCGGLHRTPPRPSPSRRLPGVGPPVAISPMVGSAGPYGKPPRSPCDLRMPSPSPRVGACPSPSPLSRGPSSGGHRLRDPSLHPASISVAGATARSPLAAQQPQRLFQQLQAAAGPSPLRGAASPKPPLAAAPPAVAAVSSALSLLGAADEKRPSATAPTGSSSGPRVASTCTAFLQPLAPIRTKLGAATAGVTSVSAGVQPSIVRDVEAMLSIPLMADDDDDDDADIQCRSEGGGAEAMELDAGGPAKSQQRRSPLDHLLEAAATGQAACTTTACTTASEAAAGADAAAPGSLLSPLALLVDIAASEDHHHRGSSDRTSGDNGDGDGGSVTLSAVPRVAGGGSGNGDDPPPSEGPKPLRSALRGMQPFFSAPGALAASSGLTGAAAGASGPGAGVLAAGGLSPPAAGSASGARTSPGPPAWFHARGGHGAHGGSVSLACDEKLDGGKVASPLPPRPRPAGKPPAASPMGRLGCRPSPGKSPVRGQADSPVASGRPLDGFSTPPSHANGKGRHSPAGWSRAISYPGHQYDSMIEDVVQQILNEASPEALPPLGQRSAAPSTNPASASAQGSAGTTVAAGVAAGGPNQAMAVDCSKTNTPRPSCSASTGDESVVLQENTAPLHLSPLQQQQQTASPTWRRSIYLPSPTGKRRRSVDDPQDAEAARAVSGPSGADGVANGLSLADGGPCSQVPEDPQRQQPLGHRRRPRKAARVDGGGGVAAAAVAAAAATAAAASDRMDLDELSNLGSDDSDSDEDGMDTHGNGGAAAGGARAAPSGMRGGTRGGRGVGAQSSLFAGRAASQGQPGGSWMKPGLAWSRSAAPSAQGLARASPQIRPLAPIRPSPGGAVASGPHLATRPALASSPIAATAATAAATRLGAPAAGADAAASPGDSLMDVPRLTSNQSKPESRRGNSYLASSMDAANARPTLEQEYREALINARLAQAWAVGERWARCDLAGLPADLSKRGVTERLAMLDTAASKLNCYRGAEGSSKIMAKVEEEWEHLRSIRIAALSRSTVRTPSGVTPSPASAAAGRGGAPPHTPLPFAALTQAASLGRAVTAPRAPADQTKTDVMDFAAAASAAGAGSANDAAGQEDLAGAERGNNSNGAGAATGAGVKPAMAAAAHHGLAELVSGHGHAYCHRGSPPPQAAPPRLHAAHPHAPHSHSHQHPPQHHQHGSTGSRSDPQAAVKDAAQGQPPSSAAAANCRAIGKQDQGSVASIGGGTVAGDATPQPQSGAIAGADGFGTPLPGAASAQQAALHQLTPPPSILKTVVPTPHGSQLPSARFGGGAGGSSVAPGGWASAAATPGLTGTGSRKAVKFATVLELGPQAGYRHATAQPPLPPPAFDLPLSQPQQQSSDQQQVAQEAQQ